MKQQGLIRVNPNMKFVRQHSNNNHEATSLIQSLRFQPHQNTINRQTDPDSAAPQYFLGVDYETAEEILREAVSSDPDNPIAQFNLGIVCLARKNRDCALSQYNRLKTMDHSLAKSLFTTIFRARVVDAS